MNDFIVSVNLVRFWIYLAQFFNSTSKHSFQFDKMAFLCPYCRYHNIRYFSEEFCFIPEKVFIFFTLPLVKKFNSSPLFCATSFILIYFVRIPIGTRIKFVKRPWISGLFHNFIRMSSIDFEYLITVIGSNFRKMSTKWSNTDERTIKVFGNNTGLIYEPSLF